MGIGDFIPDPIEHAVEKGTEWAGNRVEDVGNWTADRLEDVGWDSGADWVREQSRSVANRMGAEVDEMDLGQTDDKTKLIYGSVSKLRSTAGHLRTFQKAFDNVGDGLKGLNSAHLKGEAAEAFRKSVHIEPPKWFTGADAFEEAAKQLESFADTVAWAQAQAQNAIDKWKAGTKKSEDAADAHKKAVDSYNKAVDHYNAQPADKRDPHSLPKKPGDFHDPGKPLMQEAQEILSHARKQRNAAADTASAAIRRARDKAPRTPSYGDQLTSGLSEVPLMLDHFDAGLFKGLAGLNNFARGINPLDPYNLTHPAEYATSLNSLAAGLVTTANDPWGAGKQMLTDFLKDPSEGLGRLVPDIALTVATDGAGAGVKAARTADELADAAAAARRAHPHEARPPGEDAGKAGRKAEDCPCEGEPVDVVTGAMLMQHTDLDLPAAGLPLVFERTHLSSYRAGVTFGPTWMCPLDECLQIDAEGVVFAAADGMRLVYPVPRPDVPVLPVKGARWPLTWDGDPDGVMTVTDPATGVVRTFTGPMTACDTPGAYRLAVQSWHDRNDTRITLERDPQGLPTALRHSGGYHLAIDTTGHRVTALRLLDAAPSAPERYGPAPATAGTVVVRYGYDAAGRLTEVTNSSGLPLRFTYDDEDRVTSWTDRNGTWFRYVYDDRGRVVRTEGADGVFSGSFRYDEETCTTTYTDSLGHTSTHRYNADGQVVEKTDPLGHTTVTTWDEITGAPLSVTDPLGRTTSYTYDEDGNLTSVTRPDGAAVHATYSPLGRPVEIVEPGGAVWRHAYDDRGNLLGSTDPLGAQTRYTRDEQGRLTAVTDALGHTLHLTADAAGLPVAIRNELGETTTFRRDAFGRVVQVTDPLGRVTRTHWTIEGRLARREYADGSGEEWTWDPEGDLLTYTDAAGHTTRYSGTHFGAPTSRTDPDGGVHTFEHDTELRLTKVTNPQGRHWTYTYDAAGRLTAETDYNGRTMTYRYDAAGDLASRTNGAGQTLSFTRDVLGRVTERRSDAGEVTTCRYGPSGEVVHTAHADVEIRAEYDALGHTLAETVNGRTTTYAYDLLGRRIRRTTPSGLTSTWTYDDAGRPAELRTDAGFLSFAYDAAGRETRRDIGHGATLVQTWDAADRLTVQSATRVRTPTAAPDPLDRLLQHRTYAYRADGCLTELRDLTSGTRRFDLDGSGRVTAVRAHGWTEEYAYDAAGNLSHATVPGDAGGERVYDGALVRRAGRTGYHHDAQGRLVRRTRKLLNGQVREWHYAWNAEDRLVRVDTPQGESWRYTYDPLGRRASKQRLAQDGSIVERTDFVWDDARLIEQVTSTGEVTTWDYAPGTHRALTQTSHRPLQRGTGISALAQLADDTDRAPRFHAVITDPVGTPTELLTADGDLVWQRRDTLWGTELPGPRSPEAVACPLRFPGQYADDETGLHYNYFRYYDPQTGRYCSPDPLGLSPAPHHYAYVPNPHTHGDVLGLECKTYAGDLEDAQRRNPRVAHTLDEHVNVTREEARNLARAKDSGRNGVFVDQQTAQQVVDYALANNESKIANWLRKGGDAPLPLRGRFGANNSLGYTAHADGTFTDAGNSYVVMLQRQRGAPGGYIVSTAYPE